ncbi:hypothetical protein CPB84DRAFT_1816490 [Gymnopilus junonius]|uniref:DUF6589 domain-containing protein n=1 Tax=Gymnopilus junonius TaxID=109634 RepID=A0A9P5NJJ1_GYMJU|nr:hypothetical protein CPB84DRAFT_1816490 [Gymnopilus junonius]
MSSWLACATSFVYCTPKTALENVYVIFGVSICVMSIFLFLLLLLTCLCSFLPFYHQNSCCYFINTSYFMEENAHNLATSAESLLSLCSPYSPATTTSTSSLLLLGSPFELVSNLGESSTQPQLIQAQQSEVQKLEEKFKQMEELLVDWSFSIGDFLQDLHGVHHGLAIAQFLQGKTKVKMSDIIDLIYSHKHSAPSSRSEHYHECHASFSPFVSPADISQACPSLLTWATNLVTDQVHQEIHKLTLKEGNRSTNLITWEALAGFSITGLSEKYKDHAPVTWHLMEAMAGNQKNGVVQVGTISSFIFACNHYANGDLAMALGIWHFVAKSHVNVKCIYSWFANVEYCLVYEGGIACQSILKVSTAGTAICLNNCKPGTFDLKSHLQYVTQKKWITMTVESLRMDIDWMHVHAVQMLNWVHILVDYIPELNYLSKEISTKFHSESIAKHHMHEGQKTVVQPLGTNAEWETKIQGMVRAIEDFDKQIGKYLCSIPDNLKSFQNCIVTPEIWHMKATMINLITANHYRPSTSKDPSSLSQSSNAAQVLDCWRMSLDAKPDLLSLFSKLVEEGQLPLLDSLLGQASDLAKQYASQDTHEQTLSLVESNNAPATMKIVFGPAHTMGVNYGVEAGGVTDNSNSLTLTLPSEKVPKIHKEANDFDRDHFLANSILSLQILGVPEGDIDHVFKIIKIWIFVFAGSSHQNYVNYLLEVYCLLKYEALKDLQDAVLNNWLVNITGELGKWIKADLLQEHYNCWLEDMIKRAGGDFNDNFYHSTVSPNEENLHLFCSGQTLNHAAINQLVKVTSSIQAQVQAEDDSEQNSSQSSDGMTSGTSKTDSTNSSSQSSKSDGNPAMKDEVNKDDPSDNHLVSGSNHDIYLTDNFLVHASWDEKENSKKEGNSSAEDDELDDIYGVAVEDDSSYNSD